MAWVSDRCLRVVVGADTSLATHRRVLGVFERVRRGGIAGLRDVTPAYATLLLTFDLGSLGPERAEAEVWAALRGLDDAAVAVGGRLVEIPVCYEGECAPDIEEVAGLSGLSATEVAAVHCGAEYVVRFVGFSPGFGYLGGLPARLAVGRLGRPRARVPAGSVGIAGEQTGVYPQATAGGWRLIGRTARRMFDAEREVPSVLAMGDKVRFVAIGIEEFRGEVEGGA